MIEVPPAPARRPIRRLDDATITRIAAGEVVERPASVVKELVENAIDADARRVDVRIEGGGLDLIEVADDGIGIPSDELRLAVERHATSKLDASDPSEGVASLGFRGEALASIAAVSRFRLLSRPAAEEAAHGISVVGGVVAGTFEIGRAPGTTVEVRELFFATPARRKFLKVPAAEQVAIVEALDALYLARPSIALSLTSEGRELFRYPASARRRDAAGRVLGPAFLADSFGVDGAIAPEGRLLAVLGRPALHRPNATGLYLSVNGRAVRSRALAQAVRLAYADHLPRTRYPVGVVALELPIGRVDVNVHPTKAEVRIARERELLDQVRAGIRAALQAGPAGIEASLPVRLEVSPSEEVRWPISLAAGPALHDAALGVQTRLDDDARYVTAPASGRRPELRLLGAVFDLYWIAEAPGELWLIDQHAASERLLYDRLRAHGRIGRQELMAPKTIGLTARQGAVLAERSEALVAAGFELDPFGPSAVRVRAVPSYRGHTAAPEALAGLLDELADGGRATVPDGGVERIAASIACHAAIRGGDPIAPETLRQVLAELDGLHDPAFACPHGRPIAVRWPRGRLDRWFLRSGA